MLNYRPDTALPIRELTQLLNFLPDVAGDVPEEHTETGYHQQGLPGDDYQVDHASAANDGIGNIIVGEVKINRHN